MEGVPEEYAYNLRSMFDVIQTADRRKVWGSKKTKRFLIFLEFKKGFLTNQQLFDLKRPCKRSFDRSIDWLIDYDFGAKKTERNVNEIRQAE